MGPATPKAQNFSKMVWTRSRSLRQRHYSTGIIFSAFLSSNAFSVWFFNMKTHGTSTQSPNKKVEKFHHTQTKIWKSTVPIVLKLGLISWSCKTVIREWWKYFPIRFPENVRVCPNLVASYLENGRELRDKRAHFGNKIIRASNICKTKKI